MISRVAESCFWLGRYVERAESVARLVAVNRLIVLDAGLRGQARWYPVLVVLGEDELFESRVGADGYGKDDAVQEYLTWNEACPGSVRECLRWARENARTTREVISREMWETLNRTWQWLDSESARRKYRKDRASFFDRVRAVCAEFLGVADATMLHEEPFEFMRAGLLVERISQTARLMDVKHHRSFGGAETGDVETPWQAAQWVAQLRLCAASEPFFKRTREAPNGLGVVSFLLRDQAFPRSVYYCLRELSQCLARIEPEGETPSARLVAAEQQRLQSADVEALVSAGLATELTRLVDASASIADQLGADFFAAR